jgi:hypothetical protein
MGRCEEQAIIACGLYLLSEEGKLARQKHCIHSVFSVTEKEGEFHTLDVCKIRRNCSNVLK